MIQKTRAEVTCQTWFSLSLIYIKQKRVANRNTKKIEKYLGVSCFRCVKKINVLKSNSYI